MKVAFLFPGQGSQSAGMIARLPRELVVRKTIEEAGAVLERDLTALDTEDGLRNTENAQLLLFVAGVAIARLLHEHGVRASFVAGHSVGAFAAAVAAEVIGFEAGLRLVSARGRAMAEAFPDGYGMGAITGLPRSVVEALLQEKNENGEEVFVANWNAPDQTVISGKRGAIEQVLALASARGARKTTMLNVSVPSHNVLMSGVAQHLAQVAKAVRPANPRVPCASNSTARLLYDGQAILDDLVCSVSRPVRWHDATVALFEAGARVFVEMPPGQVLTRLAASAFPDARSLSVEESGLESVVALAMP